MKKINVTDKKDNKLTFTITGTTHSTLNTLRRTIIDYLPTMAIEDVEFRKNSSILYDEIVAHRLGLIPIKTDLKSYSLPTPEEIESGEYSAKSSLKMTLKAKGPKIVYSDNIKSKDPKVVPAYPRMPIVKLAEGQELEFIATAILGTGRVHSKWTPALVWYTHEPKLKINDKSKKLEEYKDKYPPQIFDKSGKIKKNNINTPYLIDAVDGICDDIIKVEYDENSFMFYIESWGQLAPKEILVNACDVFREKLDDFAKAVKGI